MHQKAAGPAALQGSGSSQEGVGSSSTSRMAVPSPTQDTSPWYTCKQSMSSDDAQDHPQTSPPDRTIAVGQVPRSSQET